jgi:hypothetical protein
MQLVAEEHPSHPVPQATQVPAGLVKYFLGIAQLVHFPSAGLQVAHSAEHASQTPDPFFQKPVLQVVQVIELEHAPQLAGQAVQEAGTAATAGGPACAATAATNIHPRGTLQAAHMSGVPLSQWQLAGQPTGIAV